MLADSGQPMRLVVLALLLTGCAYQLGEGEWTPTLRGDFDSCVSMDVVKLAEEHLRGSFKYERDVVEDWVSYGAEAYAGAKFQGDCEDYALTAADYLTGLGVSRKHLALATINLNGAYKRPDHAVLIVSSCVGQVVIDNTRPYVSPISSYSEYAWHGIKRLNGKAWSKAVIIKPQD